MLMPALVEIDNRLDRRGRAPVLVRGRWTILSRADAVDGVVKKVAQVGRLGDDDRAGRVAMVGGPGRAWRIVPSVNIKQSVAGGYRFDVDALPDDDDRADDDDEEDEQSDPTTSFDEWLASPAAVRWAVCGLSAMLSRCQVEHGQSGFDRNEWRRKLAARSMRPDLAELGAAMLEAIDQDAGNPPRPEWT